MMTTENALALMRKPFPANQISYLPKGGVKLAYVGHAALTDRLLDADPAWQWEPLALDAQGLPAIDEAGGLWIRLTVHGVTRLGYGDAQGKTGGNAMKERIGDALRNAAMRFGAALDLWHKGELHAAEEGESAPEPVKQRTGVMADVLASLPPLSKEDLEYYGELAGEVEDLFTKEGAAKAYDHVTAQRLENEQTMFLWAQLGSKVRSALKAEKTRRTVPATA